MPSGDRSRTRLVALLCVLLWPLGSPEATSTDRNHRTAGGRRAAQPPSGRVGPPVLRVPAPASGGEEGMRIVIGPPSGAEIRGYVVELSWLDHENERWSESSRALTRILRGSVARETLPYEWFSRAAAGRDRWRLRARSLEPPGEWSGWIEFQVAGSRGISRATPLGEGRRRGESSPPPGDRGTALTLPPSMRRPPPTRERRPAGAEEGRSSSTGPARRTPSLSSLLRSATGDSSTNAKIAPKLPTPEVKAWTWNAVKQEGAWVNLLSLSQAETVQLRWKPVQKKAEAGHWELRAGPKTGTFESAQVIHDGLIEMPGPGQEWRAFQVDLSQYPVKGSPRRYVAVRQAHFPTSAPVEIRVGEPSKLAHLLGSVKVASVDTPAWVVEGPAGSSPTFQPGNHVKVVFDYQLLKPFGGRIYPILLDENDRVSSRNYWEASEPLQGTQGKASSRMTLKCPDSMSPVARVGSILYTVTDASGKEAFKGVAPLPHLLVFRCKFSPARDDRTEILVAAPPHPSSGSLPVTMTFHSTPDCNCDYGRFNLEYPVYRSVKQGETVRLFSYLLREDGKPVRDKNQCGSDIPEHNGYGFELTGGKLSGTLLTSHGDAVYCRPPTTPGWGPIYKIKGLRVELRKHPGWNMCQNPESMPLLASDTLPLDLTVVCK